MAISPGLIVLLFFCITILPDFSSAQGSCSARCGEDYYRAHVCHCDYNCLLHKECCSDYEGLCTTANSCKGRCGEGFQRGRKCDCDAGCSEFNQCCPDYQSHCLKETPKTTVAKPTTVHTTTTTANTPQVQATKKSAVHQSPLIQKPVPSTQSSATLASSRFQAIETATSDSNSANEEIIQGNQPTSSSAVTTIQLENQKYSEFQRDDETVILEAMPYQEQFLPTFAHSFSTEPPAPSSVYFTLQSTTEAPTKPEEHANPTQPLVLESDTTRPAVIGQTTTPSALNDQEPETLSESGFEPWMTDAPATDTDGDIPSASPTQTPASTTAAPTNNPSAILLPAVTTTMSNLEDSTSLPPYSTESSTPLIAFSTPHITTRATEKPGEQANLTEPQANGATSSASPAKKPTVMSTPTSDVFLADDNNDTNLCSGRPVNGITTLLNGTMYVFRGHWFWMLSSYGIEAGYPRRITDVWGIPSPIDSVFTRCNCQGKTFFFKGNNYWRFENGGMEPGYPKLISNGFGGIKGRITAVLSVSSTRRRPESVYFFKQGGLVQKYSYTQNPPQTCKKMQTQYSIYSIRNRFARHLSDKSKDTVNLGQEVDIKLQWQGFPTSVTSAISVPNAKQPDGYDYFVFSRTQYYNINILADQPTITSPSPSSERQQSTAKDWFKCP
ncbi:proteoglycan 4-like isoform X2 [Polyodon spathula]|uniref:proteoglycan 4-like isoform X2 n=1 Tax=Polyodon spathula TaxID=7913 RepID=UPI001B7EFC50|nr:proteoglycan 4-like isoform X2 [Polyodon spathula]